MGLLRNRGPYAPQRKVPTIDWAAQQAEADRVRAETVRVEEAAKRSIEEFHENQDPMFQLVKRCHAIEQRVGRIEEQIQAIFDVIAEGTETGE